LALEKFWPYLPLGDSVIIQSDNACAAVFPTQFVNIHSRPRLIMYQPSQLPQRPNLPTSRWARTELPTPRIALPVAWDKEVRRLREGLALSQVSEIHRASPMRGRILHQDEMVQQILYQTPLHTLRQFQTVMVDVFVLRNAQTRMHLGATKFQPECFIFRNQSLVKYKHIFRVQCAELRPFIRKPVESNGAPTERKLFHNRRLDWVNFVAWPERRFGHHSGKLGRRNRLKRLARSNRRVLASLLLFFVGPTPPLGRPLLDRHALFHEVRARHLRSRVWAAHGEMCLQELTQVWQAQLVLGTLCSFAMRQRSLCFRE
jgi:hypothetical protein